MRSHLFPFRTEKLSSLTPMVLRFSRGRVGSRLFKPVPDKGAGFLLSLSERGCFSSRDIIISGLEGGAADYIDNPSPLSLFRCSCSAEQTSLAFSSLNRNVEKGDLFSFCARRLGNRVILAILGRWMIGPIVQLMADAAVLTYDCEVHRDGCIF